MPIVIHTNVSATNIQRLLTNNTQSQLQGMQRLGSGQKINQASDDAAGLQISENLRAQYRGISQALQNAMDGKNMLMAVEGTLSSVQENIQRIRELTVQAANDSNSTDQRNAIALEIQARLDDIDRITKATEWNGIQLLNPTGTPAKIVIQAGANEANPEEVVEISGSTVLGDTTANALGIASFNINTNQDARDYLTQIDNALRDVSQRRTNLGEVMNQLDNRVNYLQVARENFQASESNLRDTDVAKESSKLAQVQILQNVSVSLLAQANQNSLFALDLINSRP